MRVCATKLLFCVKALPQWSHLYGRSPVCFLWCFCMSALRFVVYPHTWHFHRMRSSPRDSSWGGSPGRWCTARNSAPVKMLNFNKNSDVQSNAWMLSYYFFLLISRAFLLPRTDEILNFSESVLNKGHLSVHLSDMYKQVNTVKSRASAPPWARDISENF